MADRRASVSITRPEEDPRVTQVADIIVDLWPHRLALTAAQRIVALADNGWVPPYTPRHAHHYSELRERRRQGIRYLPAHRRGFYDA